MQMAEITAVVSRDEALEVKIEAAYRELLKNNTREAFEAMKKLIKQRSKAQVRRMEIERGLVR